MTRGKQLARVWDGTTGPSNQAAEKSRQEVSCSSWLPSYDFQTEAHMPNSVTLQSPWTVALRPTCFRRLTSCSSSTSRALALNSPRPDELRPLPGRSQSSLYICRCSSSLRKSSMSCEGEKPVDRSRDSEGSPRNPSRDSPPASLPSPFGTPGGSAAACPSCAYRGPSRP